jgi:PleD family two-component response regulator
MLTISLGVGTVIPDRDDELLPFIDLVDKRLYRAKQRGRDCTVAEP